MKKIIIKHEDGIVGDLHDNAGTFNVLINNQIAGASNFSLLYNICMPGIIDDLHDHEVEHAIYILHGKGIFVLDQEEFQVTEDTAIFIPPNIPHKLYTTESEPLKYLVLYSPPGPEQQLIDSGASAFKKPE
jgi:uncharacterized RmlC-like cupin family protein